MSQLNIAMKKNSMRKNKKLVINIALDKESLASRLEADQDLGSSIEDEKKRFESSEKQRKVCSIAGEIDGSIDEDEAIDDDHSSARDGAMREVDVGTGLSGALNLLREQGTFKEKSKLAGVRDNRGDDRFRDAFEEIRIERVDECGRVLTTKEAFRSLSHGFHGKKPGKRKQEKRKRKHEDKSKQMESSDRAVERTRQVHAALKSCIRVIKPMHPESKRARLETIPPSSTKARLNDRFSDLPESILSIILSHLPTVEAVRTSVLSKSWRTMWTNVTALQFDDKWHREPRDNGFIQFVDGVVRDIGSLRINSFHLHSVNSYDETPLISWLSKVIECNLQKLVITWYELESVNFSPLFASLGTLVELRLHTKSILDISAPALLPKLKFFTLEDARLFNTSSVSGNISLSFPVLETFEASRVCWFRTDTVVVDSPSLRVFEMFKCSSGHVPNSYGVCTISLLAPKLEKITFSGHGSKKMLLSFPPSLPGAYLALSGHKWPNVPQWPKKFLHSFTCVKSLGLELSSDFQVIRVPKFRQLVYLHLIYDMTKPCIFIHFLKSAPILEMLSIRDSTPHRLKPSSECLKELRSQTATDCVRAKLKVVQIRDFMMQEPQLSVLRHVIANAEILGSVILSTSSQPITEEGKALVLTYPKASPHASVFFD